MMQEPEGSLGNGELSPLLSSSSASAARSRFLHANRHLWAVVVVCGALLLVMWTKARHGSWDAPNFVPASHLARMEHARLIVEDKGARVLPESFCDAASKQWAGYLHIRKPGHASTHKKYFYWFVESRTDPQHAPLVLWLTGGPGCSSTLALLAENGPCRVMPSVDGQPPETTVNPYSWTRRVNMVWVDQPAGVGFSTGPASDRDEDQVSADLYVFLQHFYNKFPHTRKLPFFVFGESYGGHYAPAFADHVVTQNRLLQKAVYRKAFPEYVRVPLHGVGVGNGMTDPAVQYAYYADMAYKNSLGVQAVNLPTYERMKHVSTPACVSAVQQCNQEPSGSDACMHAFDICETGLILPLYQSSAHRNPYNLLQVCGPSGPYFPAHAGDFGATRDAAVPGETHSCANFSAIEHFMMHPATQLSLNVLPEVDIDARSENSITVSVPRTLAWHACNMDVMRRFASRDFMQNMEQRVRGLLSAGVPVLIYAGDADYMCNWMGNKAWTMSLEFPGKAAFRHASDASWFAGVPAGEISQVAASAAPAGEIRSGGGLTFLRLYSGGHMVPKDLPRQALAMLDQFVSGQLPTAT